jgi:hypothetical protein
VGRLRWWPGLAVTECPSRGTPDPYPKRSTDLRNGPPNHSLQ